MGIKKTFLKLTDSQATIIAAAIAIVPALITSFATFHFKKDKSQEEYRQQLSNNIVVKVEDRPGYNRYVFPALCLGFSLPSSWTMDDAAAKFAGGELNLVKRYEETKGSIGIIIRLRPVQKNYINDPVAEVKNQLEPLQKIDSNVKVYDDVIFCFPAKTFHYKQRTGEKWAEVKMTLVHILPQVRFSMFAFSRVGSTDYKEYWEEYSIFKQSIVLDKTEIERRAKEIMKQ